MNTSSIIFGIILSFSVGFYFGTVHDFEQDFENPKISQDCKKDVWQNSQNKLERIENKKEYNQQDKKDVAKDATDTLEHAESPFNIWSKITQLIKSEELYHEDGSLTNPKNVLEHAEIIAHQFPLLDIFQGHFHGDIKLKNSHTIWNINISIDYHYTGEYYTGKLIIEFTDNDGDIVKEINEMGRNQIVKYNSQDDSALIISFPDGSFLHINYHDSLKIFRGHYYLNNYQIAGPMISLEKLIPEL